MGIRIFGSSCSRFQNETGGYLCSENYPSAPNPNPSRWKILETYRAARATVLKVKYLDCTNFEGEKILVYDQHVHIKKDQDLDPHFSKNTLSPIARFKPTKKGWLLAIDLAEKLSK